jgi:hypothetical protein
VRKPRQTPLSPGVLSTVHGAPREMPVWTTGQQDRTNANANVNVSDSHSEAPVSSVSASAGASASVKSAPRQAQNQPTSGLNSCDILHRRVRPSGRQGGGRARAECAYVSTMLGVVLSARGEINRHLAYACHVMRCRAMRLMGCESRALQVGRGTCWCEWLRCGSVRVVVVGSGG